jgi:uncharacterized protein
MRCPTDDTTLVMSERSGVEIDYCPECRGVWLDRGELDKILDRGAAPVPTAAAVRSDERAAYDDRWAQQPRRRKKENFLMELFGD